MTFLSLTWCDLSWTVWQPFRSPGGPASGEAPELPAAPGFYRLRPAGQPALAYLDHTTRLRRRLLGDLAPGALAGRMPYTEPHPAAPCLWAWRQAQGVEFEVSYTLTELEKRERQGLLCLLLWRYRLEKGESPWCSYGRFHPDFTRSSNRKSGIRGERRLPDEPPNPAGGPSLPPLQPQGEFSGDGWLGLDWSPFYYLKKELARAPAGPGVFRLLKPAGPELLAVEAADSLRARLAALSERDWTPLDPLYSFAELPGSLPHQRREAEGDLLGAYYAVSARLPALF